MLLCVIVLFTTCCNFLPDDVGVIGDEVFGGTVTIGGCVGNVTIGGCVGTVTTGGCVGGGVPPPHNPHVLLHLACKNVFHSRLLQFPWYACLAQLLTKL